QTVMVNWVDLRDVLVVATSTQLIVDAPAVPIADRPRDIRRQTITERSVNALNVPAAFKKVRIQQVRIEGILLDMLPVTAQFPAMPTVSSAGNQPDAVPAAKRKAGLVSVAVIALGAITQERRSQPRACGCGRERPYGGGGTIASFQIVGIVAE